MGKYGDGFNDGNVALGHTLYVDAERGNDTSGQRGSLTARFKTFAAAAAVQKPGDLTIGLPGVYNEAVSGANLIVNGNQAVRASNVLTVTTSADPNVSFPPPTQPHPYAVGDYVQVMVEDGDGVVQVNVEAVITAATPTTLTVANTGSNATWTFDDNSLGALVVIGYSYFQMSPGCVIQGGFKQFANVVMDGFADFVGGGIQLGGFGIDKPGRLKLRCASVLARTGAGILNTSNNATIEVMEQIDSSYSYGLQVGGVVSVHCPVIGGLDNGAVFLRVGGDDIRVVADEMEGRTHAGYAFADGGGVAGSKIHMQVQHIQGVTAGLWVRDAMTDEADYGIDCMHIKATAGPAILVSHNATSLKIRTFPGCRLDALLGTDQPAISLLGNADLRLNQPMLLPSGTAKSVVSDTARNLKLFGACPSTITKDSNTTILGGGSIVVDANVG